MTKFLIEPTFDEDGVQVSSGIDQAGREHPDPVPMAPPVGWNAPPTMAAFIKQFVRSALIEERAAQEGFETFDQAEDFDIPDDPLDPHTEYEAVFDPPPAAAPAVGGGAPVGEGRGDPTPPATPATPLNEAPRPAETPVKRSEGEV